MSLMNPLMCIIAFLGALSGIALAYIAPEEIRPYRRYLVQFASLMFGVAAVMPLVEREISLLFVLPLFAVIMWLSQRYFLHLRYAFPLLGLVIITSGILLPIAALFVFALGLPLASMEMEPYIKKDALKFDLKLILRRIWPYSMILVIGLLDLFIFQL